MNQTNLLQKLAPLGAVAFGAISIIGIAVDSAQAQTIGGTLGWQDNTTNFVPIGDGLNPLNESFEVTFNTELVNVNIATGYFEDELGINAPVLVSVPTTTSGFTFESNVGLPPNEAFYKNDSNLEFDFNSLVPGLKATLPAGAIFQLEQEPDGAVSAELLGGENEESEWLFDIPDLGIIKAEDSVFLFGDLVGQAGGTYANEGEIERDSIPEPSTILGLVAVGGLGLALKRKKQL